MKDRKLLPLCRKSIHTRNGSGFKAPGTRQKPSKNTYPIPGALIYAGIFPHRPSPYGWALCPPALVDARDSGGDEPRPYPRQENDTAVILALCISLCLAPYALDLVHYDRRVGLSLKLDIDGINQAVFSQPLDP